MRKRLLLSHFWWENCHAVNVKCKPGLNLRFLQENQHDKAFSLRNHPRHFMKITACLVLFVIRLPLRQQFATWFVRTFRLSCSLSRHFPLERVLLNAYYIEDLKYVNRRLSIPSGLFSPPTEESTFDPRTQPTSPPLVLGNPVWEYIALSRRSSS